MAAQKQKKIKKKSGVVSWNYFTLFRAYGKHKPFLIGFWNFVMLRYFVIFIISIWSCSSPDERTMSYLYTQLKFSWTYQTYSYFRTFQTSLYVVGKLSSALPEFCKNSKTLSSETLLHWSHLIEIVTLQPRVFYIFNNLPWFQLRYWSPHF